MATISPTEDEVFDALWLWVDSIGLALDLDGDGVPQLIKGFQNTTAEAIGNRVVMSPGIATRQDQIRREYDSNGDAVIEERHTTYSYQVDCYGQAGPNNANIVSIAWRSMSACDALEGKPITPLYADEPTQLNIVSSESTYEQRFMVKLYMQVNQRVTLTQDFFGGPVPVVVEPPVDNLPP